MKRLRNRQAQKAIYYKKLSLKLNWHNETSEQFLKSVQS